ncbi:hypothetical protein MTO96_022167 [Rhipicephalus appendiculatus]
MSDVISCVTTARGPSGGATVDINNGPGRPIPRWLSAAGSGHWATHSSAVAVNGRYTSQTPYAPTTAKPRNKPTCPQDRHAKFHVKLGAPNSPGEQPTQKEVRLVRCFGKAELCVCS